MKNKLANNDDVPIWVVLFSSEALAKVHPSWVKIADNPDNLPEQQLEKWCYWPKGSTKVDSKMTLKPFRGPVEHFELFTLTRIIKCSKCC